MIERGSGSGKWVWKVDGEEETDVELNRMVICSVWCGESVEEE
jgi:hypothetical protein